jgi:metal-sulfur cluster biosynthetic enzyme
LHDAGRTNRSVRSWRHKSSLSQCLSSGKHSLDFLANRDHHSAAYKPLWRVCCDASTSTVAPATEDALSQSSVRDVLGALSTIIDPDFGTDIVSCGFVKDLSIDNDSSQVSFRLELTTPACPVKDMFEQQAKEKVSAIPWVKGVSVTMSAQPAAPLVAEDVPKGLKEVSNIIAVSSCKGGVGKSTIAVNLAYSLAGMGARVGIFDADVYGPSLPTMVSPELRVLQMEAETKAIIPTEYMGVKLVSFGFAGQTSAIMRGPMVSGVINQLLTTTEWYTFSIHL